MTVQNKGMTTQNKAMMRQNKAMMRQNKAMTLQNKGMIVQNKGMIVQNKEINNNCNIIFLLSPLTLNLSPKNLRLSNPSFVRRFVPNLAYFVKFCG
jgi:hypothetical protein